MEKVKVMRHGDLGLVKVDMLPEGINKSKSNIIMEGSGGNAHVVENGDIYFNQEDVFTIGYLKANKNCILKHLDHGIKKEGQKYRETKPLQTGIYKLLKQQEETIDGMKPIID